MSLYDDYFTNDDKPFAENLNDALLLSNVFDLNVPIELPKMFRDSEWVETSSPRKAGVSIINVEGIDGNDIQIGTDYDEDDNEISVLYINTASTLLITVYPNFNAYGNLKKANWVVAEGYTGEELTVDILTEDKTVLLTDIPNDEVLSTVSYLQNLNRFIFRLNFVEPVDLVSFGFEMQNKTKERYGAEVGIKDVNGLEDRLDNINSELNNIGDVVEDITSDDNPHITISETTEDASVSGEAVVKNNFCQLNLTVSIHKTLEENDACYVTRLDNWGIAPRGVWIMREGLTQWGEQYQLHIGTNAGLIFIFPRGTIERGDFIYISETYLV